METYHVYLTTSDERGAGTDANVYIILYGENDDTGQNFLKSSKTNKDKFERGKTDEFVIEAVQIGDIQKIRWVRIWIKLFIWILSCEEFYLFFKQ